MHVDDRRHGASAFLFTLTSDAQIAVSCGGRTVAIWNPGSILSEAQKADVSPELLATASADLLDYGCATFDLRPHVASAFVSALLNR